jgi:hypothetical protein
MIWLGLHLLLVLTKVFRPSKLRFLVVVPLPVVVAVVGGALVAEVVWAWGT